MLIDEFDTKDVIDIWSIVSACMSEQELRERVADFAHGLNQPDLSRCDDFERVSDILWQGIYPANVAAVLHHVLKPYGMASAIPRENSVYIRKDVWRRLTQEALSWCPPAELSDPLRDAFFGSDLGL